MCTELILAFIYFTVILIINYLLFNFLKNIKEKIFDLIKRKRILTIFEKENQRLLYSFVFNSQNLNQNEKSLYSFSQNSETTDLLIIGSSYKYFKQKIKQNLYFFELLENQYLISNFKSKKE
jgi:hypothetical protein